MSVGAIDLAVLLAYMAGMVALGLWLGRGARDVAEYAVGSRDLPWWLILFSIIATETSSVTFLSIPALRLRAGLHLAADRAGVPPRPLRRRLPPAPRILPRHSLHLLRGPPPPVRRRHQADRVGAVHPHPQPGRRPAALPLRPRAPGDDRHLDRLGGDGAGGHDDRLHLRRRHAGGAVERPHPVLPLPRPARWWPSARS